MRATASSDLIACLNGYRKQKCLPRRVLEVYIFTNLLLRRILECDNTTNLKLLMQTMV